MASKKDKFLENAQKFVAKGQLDRAIKEYEQVVALDPKDTRYRQRLAELFVRVNRKEEAISEYDTIAKFYAENSYHLKAIAVYKQIQKLDPGNIATSLSLATLNEKQGLTANAIAEYDQVCAYYLNSEQYKEALKIIDKMIAADPENLNSRLKQAETEFSAGQTEKAYEDFIKLLSTLQHRNNISVFNQIADRVQSLFPARQEFVLDLIEAALKEGNAAAAAERLQEYLRGHGNSSRGWQLLADAWKSAGNTAQAKATLLRMGQLFPQDLSVQERLVTLHMEGEEWGEALTLLEGNRDAFLAAEAFSLLERFYTDLHAVQPTEIRALQGLLVVYHASGEQQKQKQIQAKIDHLRSAPVSKPAADPAPVVPAPEPKPIVAVAPAAVPVSSPPATAPVIEHDEQADHWEEELDLTFLDEEGEIPEPAAVQEENVESPPEVGEPLPVFEESSEIRDLFAELDELQDGDEVDALVLPAAEPAPTTDLEEFPDALDFADDSEEPLVFEEAEEIEEPEEYEEAEEIVAAEEIEEPLEYEEAEELEEAGEIEAQLPGVEEGFNLDFADAELDALAAVLPEAPAIPAAGSGTKQQPAGMIRIEETLDEGDAETHYNLGIAYKEMGLFDEAVSELRLAARSRERRFACLTLEGICYRDKGDMTMAEEVYRGGIELPGLTLDEKASLTFELAFLYETMGRAEEALQQYRVVRQIDPDFREVSARIAFLQGSGADHDHYDVDLLELEEVE